MCGHPELQVAWGGDFAAKIRRLADTALSPELEGEVKLGVAPIEARAFLKKAEQNGSVLNSMTMVQGYHQLGDREFRLRTINAPDGTYRYFTVKTGEGALRHELQRALSEAESALLERARRLGRGALVKQRHVVLDEPDNTGRCRLWYADNYLAPDLDEWHFETEVENEAEARRVAAQYPTRRRVTEGAKTLIFK